MKTALMTALITLSCASPLKALGYEAYVGPHFNYTHLKFNNPSHLEGYQGGVTAGVTTTCRRYFGNLNFEGTWNAGPITGIPCQRSRLEEYFLELQLGMTCRLCGNCFTPYFGFGWDRFENRQDPAEAGLLYRYDKLFIPLGLYLSRPLCGWDMAIQLEWRPDVYDRLELIGVHLDPDWGHGFRVQVPFKKSYLWKRRSSCCHFTLRIVPFFDWMRFGSVSVVNSAQAVLVIPRLIRWNTGLRVLVGCEF